MYPYTPYHGYYTDEPWLQAQPVMPSPRGSPARSPMYLDEYPGYYTPGGGYVNVPALPTGFVPLPPSPSMLAAAYCPLPPSPRLSPRVSPRLGPIPLNSMQPIFQPYMYPIDPWYVPQAGPMYMNPAYSPRAHIHPLLKDSSGYIHLNLAPPSFKPLTPKENLSRSPLIPVHQGYLDQVACYPETTKMTITCDTLGAFADSWKIVINLGRPITVGDVLQGVHSALQTPITHEEWSRLSDYQRYEPSKYYTRRVEGAEFQRVQGVRRVDFLGEKHWFAGLAKVKDSDNHNYRLLVRSR